MARTSEIEATSAAYLRDKYAIVGVGETPYLRGAGKTTRALATAAIRNALADAGLKPADVDGMLSYSLMDAAQCPVVASRSRHPAELPHGRVGRRLEHRGADRDRARRDRGRHVPDGRDLPRDERLQPAADGRQRLGRRAGRRRRAALEDLWLDLAGAVVRAGLHAPHAPLRHPARAGGDGQGRAQRARLEQPEGALPAAGHGRGRAGEPLDRQAAASARLLRRDRQRRRDRRHQRRAGARPAPPPCPDPRGRRPGLPAAPRHALPGGAHDRGRRAATRATSCGRTPASGPRRSTSPAPTTRSPSPHSCSSRPTASARRAKAAPTSATARSGSAAGAPTTPAAATCARATPTASAW